MRRLTATTIARALAMGLLVAGCAQLADLGAGSETGAAPGSGPVGPDQRTDANIEITPGPLNFGAVPCGTEAVAQPITIKNKGDLPATYTVVLPAGTSFRVEGDLEGTIAPRGVATLSVFANPRAAGENTAELVVTAGAALQQVHATAKGSGPTFELAQSTIAFGDVRKENGSTPVDIEVKNTGTESLSVSEFTSSNAAAFAVDWSARPGAFTVAPNGSSVFKVTLKGGVTTDDPAPLMATIKPNTTKFCGPAPILTVSGRRVTAEVTVGSADWGKQACNTTPASRDIVITNYANQAVTYSVVQAAGSAFTIVSEGTHTVAFAPTPTQPQTEVIKVAPKLLGSTAPLLDVKELLGVVLKSNAPGVDGRRDVPLHVETRGAIIALTPTLTFTSTGAPDRKSFTVTNTGNEDVGRFPNFITWDLKKTSTNGATSWSSSTPSSVGAGQTVTGTVDFKGVDTGLSTATLTPSQFFLSVPECKPMGSIALSGTKP